VALCFLQEGVLPLWARRYGLTVSAVLLLVFLPVLLYFTGLIVRANFPNSMIAWVPHIIAVLTIVPAIVFAIKGWTYRSLLAFSFAIWAIIFSSYLVLLPDFTRFQPAAVLATNVPKASTVYVTAPAGEWQWDLALYLPTSQSVEFLHLQNLNSQILHIFQTEPEAVILLYETEYKELRKLDSEFRVVAQANAYKNNRLTLKKLLNPKYEQLYLISK